MLGKIVKEKSGICLDQSKAYLFETRLGCLMKELRVDSYKALHGLILRDNTGAVGAKTVEALCTHETSFFRDKSPFQLLAGRLVPDFFRHNPGRTLQMLSAACATGQEVYSAAMALADAGLIPPTRQVKLLATDISSSAISLASKGEYTKFELARGIDAARLHKYFTADPQGTWRIKDEIRSMVFFKTANLLDANAAATLGKFDIIMCRNIAIYFSHEDKIRLYRNLKAMLNPKGTLIIGSTESLRGVTDDFNRLEDMETIYYRPT